jgi:ADP-ribose pyrophosphatase
VQEDMTIQPWKRRAAHLVLSAPPWVTVYREQVELPSGRMLDDFYRIVLPDFAAVVALTTDKQLVMVRGYKHGIGKVVLSVPAGLVEAGESPLQAAQRELLEETGYTAPDWRGLGSFVVDGNRHCGMMHLFVAQPARWTQPPHTDDSEELEIDLMAPATVVRAIREGEIPHLATASAVALALMAGLENAT